MQEDESIPTPQLGTLSFIPVTQVTRCWEVFTEYASRMDYGLEVFLSVNVSNVFYSNANLS